MKINSSFRHRNQNTSGKIGRRAASVLLIGLLLGNFATVAAQNNAQPGVLSTGTGFELSPAQPNIFYASTGNRGAVRGKLLTLNPQTGSGALVGATGLNTVPALAIDSKGILYAMDGQSADLYQIDAKTGEATRLVSTGVRGLQALAFDTSGVLYGVSGSSLYKIDLQDGATTHIGTIGSFFEGLAFDPIDGTLWASRVGRFQNTDGIYIVDPNTAQATLVGLTGFGGSTADLHFDAEGNLYAIKGGSRAENFLIIIDRATGKGEFVGQVGFTDIVGLTLFPQRPTGGHINVNTTAFDAGSVVLDSSHVFGSLIIRSVGTENLVITGIDLPEGPFSLQNAPRLPLTLTPGEADTIEIVFTPDTAGVVTHTMTITSNDPDDGAKEVVLSGEGFSLNPAEVGKFYAAALGFSIAGSLLELDSTTGAGALIGRTEVPSVPDGLAIDSRGVIWGLSSRDASLYFIDAASGAAALAVETNLSGLRAISFDENDVLYAAGSRGLFTIDTNTGVSNLIASIAVSFADLAFDPIDGSLWGSAGDGVYRFDQRTGTTSLIGIVRKNRPIPAIHFDNEGHLFGIVSSFFSRQDSLISIDKSNGSGTVIGSTGFRDITGLVLRPQQLEGKQLGVSLPTVNFGTVLVGDTLLMPLTLKNIGTEAITVSEVSLAEAPFSLPNPPMLPQTLGAGESQTLRILFRPTAGGITSDTLTIRSDAANTPVRKIVLRGEGFVIQPAALDVFYASTTGGGSQNAAFLSIDPTTGMGTHIGFTGIRDLPALAVNSEGFIYGIEEHSGDIYRIDAATGAAFFLASTGLFNVNAIAFDEDDSLFGVRNRTLYRIDITSGAATPIGSIPVSGIVQGLAFDPIDGALWASVGGAGNDAIYVVNPATAAATLVGKTGLKVATADIHFDSEGNMFGVVNDRLRFGKSEFVAIDRTHAKGRVIGEIGTRNVEGLAFYTRRLTGPQIAIRPFFQLDMGNVLVDSISGEKTITLQSIGSEDLALTAISLPAGPFSLAGIPALPAILPPDSSLVLEVVFSPVDTGEQTTAVMISSNDAGTPERELGILGNGLQINRAAPGAFYAAVGDRSVNSGMLITVNPGNGAGTFVGPSGLFGIEGLAINSQGLLLGLESSSRDLYYLDAVTGEASQALNLDRPYLTSIAFAANDTLYGFDRDSLYTIDLKSGASTAVRAIGRSYHGMAFDPTDGTLWAVIRNAVYKINLRTGGEFFVGGTAETTDIGDILFDNEGRLFGVQRRGPSFGTQFCYLLAFDKATGKETTIGKIGFQRIRGFAFAPVDTTITAVAENGDVAKPERFALAQNYPNPFNPETHIAYALPVAADVTLEIYNMLGQRVRVLVNQKQPAGVHRMIWDGTDDSGRRISSGVYVYRLRAGAFVQSRKLLVLR